MSPPATVYAEPTAAAPAAAPAAAAAAAAAAPAAAAAAPAAAPAPAAAAAAPAPAPAPARNNSSAKHIWILVFAGLLVLSVVIWVIFAGLGIHSARGESQKTFDLGGTSPVNVSVTFSPTLYHGEYKEHGNVAIIYDKNGMDREMARLQLQLNDMVSKAFEKTLNDQSEKYGKRVDDTWSAVQGIGLISAIIGVLITVLVLYFSFQNTDSIKEHSDRARVEHDAIIAQMDAMKRDNSIVLGQISENEAYIIKVDQFETKFDKLRTDFDTHNSDNDRHLFEGGDERSNKESDRKKGLTSTTLLDNEDTSQG